MRAAIVAAARGWLGTPYRHQASVRGEGADCLGLVRGVWRELIGAHYPAMAVVEVKGLIEDAARVEIETTAVIPA